MIGLRSLLVGIFAISVCVAQSVNISGKVTDTGGTAISGALVMLGNAGLTATTGADGSFTLAPVNVHGQNNQSLPYKLSAKIHNGVLSVNVAEKSAVEITTFDLHGKALSRIQQTMDGGIHSISLPHRGAGIYLYKVKSGNNELLLKGNSIDGVSQAVSVQGSSSDAALSKQAKVAAVINDVIAVTKTGYLDYREIMTNSDTSGIQIKMIVCADTVTDADGNVYQAVKIGNQVWTVENLRTTKYNDRSAIPLVTVDTAWADLTTDGYCYYNNTTNADSIKKFGALYNWNAASLQKLAPSGWHVPSDPEWNTLQNYLIANGYNWNGFLTGNMIAKSMAAKTDWFTDTSTGTIGKDLTINNRSGFSALPGGLRYNLGFFSILSSLGYWWSVTGNDVPNAYSYYLINTGVLLGRSSSDLSYGFSVRLVKN